MRAVVLAAVLVAFGGLSPQGALGCVNPPRPSTLLPATVTSVIDGDTVRVRLSGSAPERVRLLGIDTPEVHDSAKMRRDVRRSGRSKEAVRALGLLAARFTTLHLDGRAVGLELDVQPRDVYGRLLAYVWLDDGTLFNMLILREGYAQVLTVPPNVRYADLFLACQQEARVQGRGLWGR
ncbi:MAG: thermonuclease family protein [Armatimonadota bacterium]|nr:thermonuclease family protein [Armatimonadota bacterium]